MDHTRKQAKYPSFYTNQLQNNLIVTNECYIKDMWLNQAINFMEYVYDSNVNIHRTIRVLMVFEYSKYVYNSIPLVVEHTVPMNSNQYQEVARI